MRILGLDPGIAITGWAVLEISGNKSTYIDGGVITTPAHEPTPQRLLTIYEELEKIMNQFTPQAGAIEKLFFNSNQKTALTVSEARGVAVLQIARHHLNFVEITPLQVKQTLTSYGAASKNQVGQMVKLILKLPTIPKPDDHADAVAIALTGVMYLPKLP